jgi:hypothetical protein
MKFMGILTVEDALKAVESNGYALRYVPAELRTEAVALKAVEGNCYALQYVLKHDLFLKIAARFGIKVES